MSTLRPANAIQGIGGRAPDRDGELERVRRELIERWRKDGTLDGLELALRQSPRECISSPERKCRSF